jgi:uncharacterized protein YndB with AHSA1/START domain
MPDIANEISRVNRQMRSRSIAAGGDARAVLLRRSYESSVKQVWLSLTDASRISQWFLPVTGSLTLNGKFRLDGNISGEVLCCEPDRMLRVSWILGESPASEVEVRLWPGDGGTELELEHAAVVDKRFWAEFGPGAAGVGWDLSLLGLSMYLAGETMAVDEPQAGQHTPEFRELVSQLSHAWGAVLGASGGTAGEVTTAVEHTLALYAPPVHMFATRAWMRASRAAFLDHFVVAPSAAL